MAHGVECCGEVEKDVMKNEEVMEIQHQPSSAGDPDQGSFRTVARAETRLELLI